MSKVQYRNQSIGRGSVAYGLWETKNFKELDRHLKALDKANEDLIKHYEDKSPDGKNRDRVMT